MIRLFVGLDFPAPVRAELMALAGAIPGARWMSEEQLHLTLRFIGEVDERMAEEIDLALARIAAPAFELTLQGLGQFGDGAPHTLWAGVAPNEALTRLAAKVDSALRNAGFAGDNRRFTPHVTLARLKNVPLTGVMAFIAEHGLFRGAPFLVSAFTLFSSHLGHGGSHYVAEADYPLTLTRS